MEQKKSSEKIRVRVYNVLGEEWVDNIEKTASVRELMGRYLNEKTGQHNISNSKLCNADNVLGTVYNANYNQAQGKDLVENYLGLKLDKNVVVNFYHNANLLDLDLSVYEQVKRECNANEDVFLTAIVRGRQSSCP